MREFVAKVIICAVSITLLTGASFWKKKAKKGEGGTEVVAELTKCAQPIGTAALLEVDNPYYTQIGLTSPVPLLKLMMARSNCFRVVDRGATSKLLKAERALAQEGDLQKGSNMGGGQMAAADYIINPQIVHKDADAGGGAGGLGSLLPGRIGAIAGGIKVKKLEAQVLLTLINVRTSVQEAVVEGSASKSDIGFGGFAWIGGMAGGGGAYESTDIGKITAVAFLDAHNKLVAQLGGIPVGSANTDNAGYVTSSQVNFRAGPSTEAPSLGILYKGTSVIRTGVTNGAWWEVEAIGKTGWVHSDFLTR